MYFRLSTVTNGYIGANVTILNNSTLWRGWYSLISYESYQYWLFSSVSFIYVFPWPWDNGQTDRKYKKLNKNSKKYKNKKNATFSTFLPKILLLWNNRIRNFPILTAESFGEIFDGQFWMKPIQTKLCGMLFHVTLHRETAHWNQNIER